MGGRDKGNILLRRANFVGTKNCGGEKARAGWEAARPCVSKEAKPAKIDSLIEKILEGAQLKMFRKFFCFAQRSGERKRPEGEHSFLRGKLGGIAARRAAIKSRCPDFRQKKFLLR